MAFQSIFQPHRAECDEYKDLIANITIPWRTLLTPKTCGTKNYNCGSVGHAGLIVGGDPAKVGEFPHMAGEFEWKILKFRKF